MQIQYIKSKEIYEIESIEQINDNVVQITGDIPIQEYGFMLSDDGVMFDGDYSQYRTIYRKIDGGAQFSNNGNVWAGGDDTEFDIPEFDENGEQNGNNTKIITLEELQSQIELLTGCILEMSEALYG